MHNVDAVTIRAVTTGAVTAESPHSADVGNIAHSNIF
jgi:hypothetical protein